MEWTVRNPGRAAVVVDRIGVEVATPPVRVLEHGWQSWSVVRRCDRGDVRRQRGGAPHWRNAMFMAEPRHAGHTVCGDQFLLDEAGVTGFLSASSHLGTVAARADRVTAWALLDGVQLQPKAERPLDPVWIARAPAGGAGAAYSRFAELWGRETRARTAARHQPGWCSWYWHFGAVTPDDVRRAAAECRRYGLPVVQIDDGYQAAIGDWTSPAPSWPDGGPGPLGRELSDRGLTAGIWTAPFLAGTGSRLLADHPEWVQRDERGRPVRAMHHPGLWGGWAYALDTTRPEVLDHLRRLFTSFVDDGFTYFKLDFLYAGALRGRRHDEQATRAQALRAGLDAIREAVGDDGFVLACGCPLGPAAGVVDAMRVSADIGRRWAKRSTVRGYAEAKSGLRNSVRASVLRAPLHRRLWINDPDCVLLDPTPTGLSAHHRQLMADVVAGTGGFVMLSDDLAAYGEEEWGTVARLAAASGSDAPLDLVDPFAAAPVVRSPVSRLEVDWRGEGRSVLVQAAGSAA